MVSQFVNLSAFLSANVTLVTSPVFSNNLKREMFLHRREDLQSVARHTYVLKRLPFRCMSFEINKVAAVKCVNNF